MPWAAKSQHFPLDTGREPGVRLCSGALRPICAPGLKAPKDLRNANRGWPLIYQTTAREDAAFRASRDWSLPVRNHAP